MTAPLSMDEMGGSGGIIGKCAGKCQHFANPALALNPPFLFVRTKSPYPRRAEPLRGSPARWLRQAGFGLPDCSRAAVAAWSGLLQVLDCTIQKRGYNLDCIIQK
ncbi:hypothetical protein AVM72_16555 (plasmid) [Piscirickettsia salmonis]|nr:hypothetical protein AVM72_16555 [Piscirickettsia salmonis]APS81690.1 hypothetical protein AVM73_16545 [Piscirickettsia salmonis]